MGHERKNYTIEIVARWVAIGGVHYGLRFTDGPNNRVVEMHGGAYDPRTGEYNHTALDGDHLLAGNVSKCRIRTESQTVSRMLYQTNDPVEFIKLVSSAAQALEMIGHKRDLYSLWGPNSNSVARTLTEAMGLEFVDFAAAYGPGSDEQLLSDAELQDIANQKNLYFERLFSLYHQANRDCWLYEGMRGIHAKAVEVRIQDGGRLVEPVMLASYESLDVDFDSVGQAQEFKGIKFFEKPIDADRISLEAVNYDFESHGQVKGLNGVRLFGEPIDLDPVPEEPVRYNTPVTVTTPSNKR